jgi:hypothetical protein
MKLLVYSMESSGASTFCYFLAQYPGSVAVVDLWSGCVAPRLDLPHPVVVKATISSTCTLDEHKASFAPDRTIFFIRDPVAIYASLIRYRYANMFGTVEEKMATFDSLFMGGKFDLTIRYEDFVARDANVINQVKDLGWDCSADYYGLTRSIDEIREHNSRHSSWLRENFPQCWGFGNFKGESVNTGFCEAGYSVDIIAKVASVAPGTTRFYRPEVVRNSE